MGGGAAFAVSAGGTAGTGRAEHPCPGAGVSRKYVLPARRYPTGQLPAGRYDAVRIDIGSGGGRNWWCVLYPGLCSFAQGGYALPAENDLVCGQYILRFRLVDWAHRLTARRQTVLLAG